jgi:hypothetical protein
MCADATQRHYDGKGDYAKGEFHIFFPFGWGGHTVCALLSSTNLEGTMQFVFNLFAEDHSSADLDNSSNY